MRILLTLLFFILLQTTAIAKCDSCHIDNFTTVENKLTLQDLVIIKAENYLYLRELTNNNDAPEIDKFLAYLGLPKGLSWCAAYVIFAHKEAADVLQIKNPLPKYGKVSTLWDFAQENGLRYKTFDAEEVLSGEVKLKKADLAIWASGLIKNGDFSGHIEINRHQKTNDEFNSIGGNTTSGDKGDQREGGGVYIRERKLAIGTNFQVLGFIRVR